MAKEKSSSLGCCCVFKVIILEKIVVNNKIDHELH